MVSIRIAARPTVDGLAWDVLLSDGRGAPTILSAISDAEATKLAAVIGEAVRSYTNEAVRVFESGASELPAVALELT